MIGNCWNSSGKMGPEKSQHLTGKLERNSQSMLNDSFLLGLDGETQLGGVLGVTLTINQHQRDPLVALDDVADAAEMLLPFLLSSQSVLVGAGHEADGDVVHSVPVKHHQRVGLLCVLTRALPHHKRPVFVEV